MRDFCSGAYKSSWDRTIPASAADWGARYREALARWSSLHPADEAARLAWSEIENDWHKQYGQRVPHWRCAGCREPIGGLENLMLGDGYRVHLHKLECLLRFGKRWRNEATAGLRALGLELPPGFEPP